ncbi:MAG: lysis system o-spanin lipoprotein Rz1 [Candidatus Phlomobacter fragariae]
MRVSAPVPKSQDLLPPPAWRMATPPDLHQTLNRLITPYERKFLRSPPKS